MAMNKKETQRRKDTGTVFQKFGKSFGHAIDGIVYALENELNMLVIMVSSLIVLIASLFFKISTHELVAIVICIGTVMASEMINTAIEAVVDLETTKENKLAKIAKDSGSSATLIFAVMSVVTVGLIFIPKIIDLF